MTTSYDVSKLTFASNFDFNTVRFLLGDTDMTSAQLLDEEITFAITVRGNPYGATAFCAQALAAKYARLVTMSADGVSVQYSARAKQFADIAADYLTKESLVYAAPYAGGTSQADMRTILSNTDRVPDIFRFGQFDNPPSDGVAPAPGLADLQTDLDTLN